MGELEKYLESKELKPKFEKAGYDLRMRCYDIKREIESIWQQDYLPSYRVTGEEVEVTDMDKLIYYLVKKGIP
ncbi:MAG TPA: hypothetical protein ENH91_08905 [Leeuwenhoekiella sp.]|nr:hypothetical protein [Leeuwenhoekiella sp.]